MKNVFLVKSPLQLLNAIEAKHHYKLEDDDCYLVVMGDRKSYSQIMKLVYVSRQWKNIILISRVGLHSSDPWCTNVDLENIDNQRDTLLRSSFFTIWRLNNLSRTAGPVRYVFIGDNNNSFMRHFVNTIKHDETILLDDGTATLDIAKQRLEGYERRKPNRLSKKIKLMAKRYIQGLKDSQPDKVTFFTAYKIDVLNKDKKVVNDFAYLRAKSSALPVIDKIYFLGSPLSEVGLVEEDSYIDQLREIRTDFSDKDFVYVAHRREKKDKLDFIRRQLNIEVCLFDYPIEYQLAMIGPRPEVLVSFMSSALDNLSIIMQEALMIISYKLREGSYKNKTRIDEIYQHYEMSKNKYFQLRHVR